MDIWKSGSRPSSKGSSEWFSGQVRMDPLFQPQTPARATGIQVTFEPGARTAWHTHPLGQTLIVTAGYGLVQREGETLRVTEHGRPLVRFVCAAFDAHLAHADGRHSRGI